MSIRSDSKAIIIHNNQVLLNKCCDVYNGDYYSLPGGGQETYETMEEAVVRECLEETGYAVAPERFAALCEEICDSEFFRENYPDYAHKMLHIFVCRLTSEEIQPPTETDDMQVGIEWVDMDKLPALRLLPKALGENMMTIIESDAPLFLGSAHIPYNHG